MTADTVAITLISLGALMLSGLAVQAIGARTHVPRVSMLILLGVAIGPVGFDVLPDLSHRWFEYITTVALTMIGFLLGGKLNQDAVSRVGRTAFVLSLVITLGTFGVVALGMLAIGAPAPLALIMAGVALATDPIATLDVVRDSTSDSRLKSFLPPLVALDDAWGLLMFSVVVTFIYFLSEGSFSTVFALAAIYELLGSVVLGIALGLPMALLSGRIKQGEPTLVEALGAVMLCAGLSLQLEVSYLLTAIVMGSTVAITARHHKFAFHEIEHIEWPFLMLFLILVGASFEPGGYAALSMMGIAYVVLRIIGRVAGAHLYLPAYLDRSEKTWLGLSLLPQAGVALGAAIYARQYFPETAQQVIGITIGATIIFELIGPMMTAWSLRQTRRR